MTCDRLAWHKLLQYQGEHILKISSRSVDTEKLLELPFKEECVIYTGQIKKDCVFLMSVGSFN